MDDLASRGADGGFKTGNGSAPVFIALVAPELDLSSYRTRCPLESVGEPVDRALGNTVYWSPRPKLTQAAEQVEPRAESPPSRAPPAW